MMSTTAAIYNTKARAMTVIQISKNPILATFTYK
jgi:hypothetical protein